MGGKQKDKRPPWGGIHTTTKGRPPSPDFGVVEEKFFLENL